MTSAPVDALEAAMGGCPGELWVGEQRWDLREVMWRLVKVEVDGSVPREPGAEVTDRQPEL